MTEATATCNYTDGDRPGDKPDDLPPEMFHYPNDAFESLIYVEETFLMLFLIVF